MKRTTILLISLCFLFLCVTSVSVYAETDAALQSKMTQNVVKLEWEVCDVNVTCTSNPVWDTENLTWTDDKTYTATDGFAKFTVTNYGTDDVVAEVSFEASETLSDAVEEVAYTNNPCVVSSAVSPQKTEYTESDFVPVQITATVTVNADAFASCGSGCGTLGTYTVTLRADGPQ